MEIAPLPWPQCAVRDCIGIQIADGDKCLAHAPPARARHFLSEVKSKRLALDLRGTTLDEPLLEAVLDSRYSEDRLEAWAAADFSFATITAERGQFTGTDFVGRARFVETCFHGTADFDFCHFRSDAHLDCRVEKFFRITDSVFEAGFNSTGSCGTDFLCEGVTCRQLFLLDNFSVGANLVVHRTEFEGVVVLFKVEVAGDAEFVGCRWTSSVETSYNVNAGGWLILDESEFVAPADWRSTAAVISCVGTTFRDTTTISASDCDMLFDRAVFAGPARVIGEGSTPRQAGEAGLVEELGPADADETETAAGAYSAEQAASAPASATESPRIASLRSSETCSSPTSTSRGAGSSMAVSSTGSAGPI